MSQQHFSWPAAHLRPTTRRNCLAHTIGSLQKVLRVLRTCGPITAGTVAVLAPIIAMLMVAQQIIALADVVCSQADERRGANGFSLN